MSLQYEEPARSYSNDYTHTPKKRETDRDREKEEMIFIEDRVGAVGVVFIKFDTQNRHCTFLCLHLK